MVRRDLRLRAVVVAVAALLGLSALGVSEARATTSFKLPFSGTWNVTQGDHPNLDGTGHNWDFQPLGGGSHNDEVLAVAAGTASVTCSVAGGTANVRLSVGGQNFGYGHLQASSVPPVGTSWQVGQGDVIGRLFPQPTVDPPYSDDCGTLQASHLHFGFPSVPFSMDGITYNSSGPLGVTPVTSSNVQSPTGAGYRIAFLANSGNLWTFNSEDALGTDRKLGMMKGTSTAIAVLQDGSYRVAFQANNGNLWTFNSKDKVGTNRKLGMMKGTSPAMFAY